MEKYRKFEDPTNGVNPFIPDSTKKRSLLLKVLYGFQLLIGLTKLTCFISLFIAFVVIQSLRHVLVVPKLKRSLEFLLCKAFGRVFLILLGVWTIDEKVGKVDKKRVPNIFVSSQSSIIDWVVLMTRHAPKFLWIVKSPDSKNVSKISFLTYKDIFIELTYFDLLFFGMGLKFLSTKEKTFTAFNVSDYIIQDNQVPLVIFPEATKTNRKGVLSIRSNLMDSIYNFVNDHGNLLIRSEVIVKKSQFFSPANTTEYSGLKTLLHTLSQVFNSVEVISQDIPNNNFDKSLNYDRSKFSKVEDYLDFNVQSHLVEPNSRNVVSLSSFDHISFLEYFHQTHKDASYIKKED